MIQSVDNEKLAAEISRLSQKAGSSMDILIEVISAERKINPVFCLKSFQNWWKKLPYFPEYIYGD